MEQKHYKKYLRQLLDAGISMVRIEKECEVSQPTIRSILRGESIPSDTIQKRILKGCENIVKRFMSL